MNKSKIKKPLFFIGLITFGALTIFLFYNLWYTDADFHKDYSLSSTKIVNQSEHTIMLADNLLHSRFDELLNLKDNYSYHLLDTSKLIENMPYENVINSEHAFIKSLDSIDNTRLQYVNENDRDKLDVVTASFRFILQNKKTRDTVNESSTLPGNFVAIYNQAALKLKDSLKTSNTKINQLQNQIKNIAETKIGASVSANEAALKQKIEFLSWALRSQVNTNFKLTSTNNTLKQNITDLTAELNELRKLKSSQ